MDHEVDTRTDQETAPPTASDRAAEVGRPFLEALPGLIRRVRRRLEVSQRELAAMLGVSQSRVARWETGRTIPSAADLEDVLTLTGAALVAMDEHGEAVRPMDGLAIRDRADRYYPAHCDPRATGWWSPPGSLTSVEGAAEWRRSRELVDAHVTYHRGVWRAMMRAAYGAPPDHPTLDEVVGTMRAGEEECSVLVERPETVARPAPLPD